MAAQCDGIFPPSTACATVGGGTLAPVPFTSITGGTLGTMAFQNATAVAITGGTITGLLKSDSLRQMRQTRAMWILSPPD